MGSEFYCEGAASTRGHTSDVTTDAHGHTHEDCNDFVDAFLNDALNSIPTRYADLLSFAIAHHARIHFGGTLLCASDTCARISRSFLKVAANIYLRV